MKKQILNHLRNIICLIAVPLLLASCEDFLDVEEPLDQIDSSEVYEDEATATAAISSLYGNLRDEVILTGQPKGMGALMGVYADEMDYYGYGGEPLDNFYQHNVFSDDLLVESTWNGAYALLFKVNASLEGLESSESLSTEIKIQLRGEALFIRAFTYFNLVNLFGDIPYPTTTDYEINSTLPRISINEVYDKVIADLRESKNLLGSNYVGVERIRANEMVASALLSRVYLYTGKFDVAETEAGSLINNTTLFSLEPDLTNEFLKESRSAIFQFKPKNEGDNTHEASLFILESGPPFNVALNRQLYYSMEPNDLRKEHWIGEVTDGNQTWYFPTKYKEANNTGTSVEYSIVLRLSEQYLIRAEARAKLGNLSGALEDLNVLRNRAGLTDLQATTEGEILDAIFIERYHELFSEFGHRWFDMKRTGRANGILAPIKSGWKPTDIVLPIPENELAMNPNLNPQNPGY